MLAAVRIAGLGVALGLALACLGCGERGSQSGDDAFRVGLLTPGSVRDGGWNQSAYEGIERIRSELGAEVAHQETRTPQDFEEGFRDFASRGFDLVFGHGFEFQDAAAKVAAEAPATVFVTTSGSTVRANLAPIVFELEQATYALGFLAARLARQGRVGMIGGVKVPSVASTFEAFAAGAQAVRPEIQVSTSYIGSWTDVAAAREATLAQIAQGADVLIHNANEAARGFFQAVAESPGVRAFGTNRNQNDMAPRAVLASATIDIPLALLRVAREVQAGEFQARPMRFGLAGQVIRIEWNDALAGELPPVERAAVDALIGRIESGEVIVPRGDF
jgi:basic membrane lipoprotein Med (substrate-binding protein (PBP1-ABC) superfamily)